MKARRLPVIDEYLEGDQVVFVQYSSGSTAEPHGCELTADAIAWQLAALETRLKIDPERDRCVSWLASRPGPRPTSTRD